MLVRTFLRLCALEALRPSALLAADGPWPTLAGRSVFDSRIDPIDDLAAGERRPIVAVYTDETNLDKIAQHGPALYKSTVDLVFELSVVAKEREGDDYVAGVAFTDAELDADLDLFEEQIFFALHYGATGALFRKLAKLPLIDWHSMPQRTSEEGYRLAMRTIRAQVPLKELCYDAAPVSALSGLDRLPQPLQSLAGLLTGSTYLAKIANAVALKAPTAAVVTPLNEVGLNIDMHVPVADADPAAPRDVNATASVPQG